MNADVILALVEMEREACAKIAHDIGSECLATSERWLKKLRRGAKDDSDYNGVAAEYMERAETAFQIEQAIRARKEPNRGE